MTAIPRTRSRDEVPKEFDLYEYVIVNPSSSKVTVYSSGNLSDFPTTRQTTVDEIHTEHPNEGGPFHSTKIEVNRCDAHGKRGADFVKIVNNKSYRYAAYTQGGTIIRPSSVWLAPLPSLMSEAKGYGPDAWDRFRPAKPDVSLSVFFAELRDIPGLVFKKLNSFRSLGNNYLAVEFGWKPFLSDLRSWYESIIKIDQRLAQLRRDNGQYVKRGGTLFKNNDSEVLSQGTSTAYKYTGVYPSPFRYKDTRQLEEECWFSARFRYYIPGLDNSFFGKAKGILHLWDLEVTPEQIWNLIPFSWLVDWFSNVGSVVANLMAAVQENLTAKYAYIMLQRKETFRRPAICGYPLQTAYLGPTITKYDSGFVEVIRETKVRAEASPFGFNFNWSALSSKQAAILIALGLSNLKF